jgi:hypothetical protein
MEEYIKSLFPREVEEESKGGDENFLKIVLEREFRDFRLPIDYLEGSHRFELSDIVSKDLELVATSDQQKGMYNYLFRPRNTFGHAMIPHWNRHYTTNMEFLNDTQSILKKMGSRHPPSEIACDNILSIWERVKYDPSFLEKYSFVDWEILKSFNYSTPFLQTISMINIISPLLSLIFPFLLLLLPFFILKIQGISISIESYIETLKSIAHSHFIGKTLLQMESFQWDKVFYMIISFGMYLFQIYQNVNICTRFFRNIEYINNTLIETRDYLDTSISEMENYLEVIQDHGSYTPFKETIENHYGVLVQYRKKLASITPFQKSLLHFQDVGYMLKCYYTLHDDKALEESFRFSMCFNGYMDNIYGIIENNQCGNIEYTTFIGEGQDEGQDEEKKHTRFHKQYYPPLMEESPIENDTSFEKNIILSGPNKAGKTTILKTTLMNIIFSQQIGMGFFKEGVLVPYSFIHSYLNIPDTSGRDSLFQAESRRCKDILDVIIKNTDKKKRHFCIFDELYSGTNPEEATNAGRAFLTYLNTYDNVDFILTTHYLKICNHYKKSDKIQNYKMLVLVSGGGQGEEEEFEYTYKMKKGISKIKGGLRVLKDLEYPSTIIDEISKRR